MKAQIGRFSLWAVSKDHARHRKNEDYMAGGLEFHPQDSSLMETRSNVE